MSFEQYAAARMESFGRLAYVLTGDPHEAHDLLQETFTRLYVGWPRIRDRGALDAFTTTTMTRVLLSWRRRPVWRRERLSADPVAAAKPVAVDFADRVVHRDALAEALNHLSPQQRAVIALRYYLDLSEQQMASQLGCSVGTVKSQASRGLARLRTVLDDPTVAPSTHRTIKEPT